jgi:hypothetical protein
VVRGILFLDFDGVMHPFGCAIDQYFCRLALLEDWLRQRAGVDIVISSSWREVHPLDEMRSYFSVDLQQRILATTPLLWRDSWSQFDGEPPPVRFEREEEVRRWLHQSGLPWQPWAALDDQAWRFRPFCQWLVVCDGKVGLTPRELTLVDRLLALKS